MGSGYLHKTLPASGEKYWPQILAIFAVSLGSFTNGIQFSWSSPFSLSLTKDKVNYNITEEDASLFMTFQPLGMIITSLFYFKVAEHLGRKKSLQFLAIPQLLCWLVIIFAKTKWEFYVARFIAGFADTAMFCSVLPYVGEITIPRVRGTWGNAPIFVFYGGQFFVTVIGSYFSVRVSAYICIGFPVLFGIFAFFLPESPYQLIKDGKMDEAKQSIRWLRRKSNIEDDFLKLKSDVARQVSESGTWMDLIKIPSNRRALRAGMFLRIAQQFCGSSTFGTYTQLIFAKAGGHLSPQQSSMIYVGLLWGVNFVCIMFVEKFGRKLLFFYSLLSSSIVLFGMAVYFFLEQYKLVYLVGLNWLPLTGMVLFVFTYSFGLGVVPTLMLGELFSVSVKSKGLAILMGFFGFGIFITVGLFHLLTSSAGLYAPFLLYSVTCFGSTFLTIKWVPETKGRTLEEIQQSLKKT